MDSTSDTNVGPLKRSRRMATPMRQRSPVLAGVSAALQGFPGALTPIILAVSAFGLSSVPWSFWGVLAASTLGLILLAWLGGSRQLIAGQRSASTVVFITLVAQTSPRGADGATLQTVLIGAQVALVLAGVWLLLASRLKAGQLLRMIPYPVIAGVSNATAIIVLWLAVQAVLSDWQSASVIALAMVLAAWLWTLAQTRAAWAHAIPSVLPACAVGVALLLWVFPGSTDPVDNNIANPWQMLKAAADHWPGLHGNQFWEVARGYGSVIVPGSLALALLLALEAFVAAVRLEAEHIAEIDYDLELRGLGAANVFCGLIGGLPVSRSVVRSLAIAGSRNNNWAPHLACMGVTVLGLLALSGVLLELPAGVIAGLLLLEAALIVDPWTRKLLADVWRHGLAKPWMTDQRFQSLLLLALITMIGVFGSLLWATVAGLALAIMFVLVRLSQNLTAHWEYADTFRSRRMRSLREDQVIRQRIERIGVLVLKGSLFFGNSFRISALSEELSEKAHYALLDFTQVADVDASGAQGLRIMIQRLEQSGCQVEYSGISLDLAERLEALGMALPSADHRFRDLDHALESAENHVLTDATVMFQAPTQVPLHANALLAGLAPAALPDLIASCKLREYGTGQLLFHEGRMGEGVMMIEYGLVTVIASEEPEAPRVATLGPGQFLGEMSFVEGGTYSRSAKAERPTRVAVLSREAMDAFARKHPVSANIINNNIARELANRLRATTVLLASASGQGRWVRTGA
jgi:SulP family sulfate permease